MNEVTLDRFEASLCNLLVPLRLHEGLDDTALQSVFEHLRAMQISLAATDFVPKRLAALLRHIWTDVFCSIDYYQGDERSQIEEALALLDRAIDNVLGRQ